jgi:hypothetical protein
MISAGSKWMPFGISTILALRDRRFKRPMEAGNVVGGRVRWDTERGMGESGC